MLLLIIFGLLAALAAPLLHRVAGAATGKWLALVPLGMFVYLATWVQPLLARAEPQIFDYPWVPTLDVSLTFYLDGYSLFFALLISGFGVLIVLYAGDYLRGHAQLGRFYLYLLLFMTAMLGLVLSGHLVLTFVFWEMTSLSSYLLIGFNHADRASRAAALQALLVTVSGGLALLAGVVLLGQMSGSYAYADVLAQGEAIRRHPHYAAALGLVALGCFTKSAQFPFHFWLPNAMAAPTPVSAYLHSATMVKAGVFLLARLQPALGGTAAWQYLLVPVGTLTMLTGAIIAIQHADMKKMLAYVTVSALGLLVLLLGVDNEAALRGALVFLLAHAFYKAALFMVAGNVDHEAGTKNVDKLAGLRRQMPATAAAAVLACLSMAGFPLLLGFIGKELVYEALLHLGPVGWAIFAAVFLTSALYVALAVQLSYGVFFGTSSPAALAAHEAPWPLLTGPLVLAVGGLLLGVLGQAWAQPLLERTYQDLYRTAAGLDLSLWHGLTPVLGWSLVTLAMGGVLSAYLAAQREWSAQHNRLGAYGPEKAYLRLLEGVSVLAVAVTRRVQNGYLRNYLTTIVATFLGVMAYAVYVRPFSQDLLVAALTPPDARLHEVLIVVNILAGLVMVLLAASRLTALASLGIVGYGLAVFFLFFGAPDVAMTQFLIETLTLLLFVLVLHRLPNFSNFSRRYLKFKYMLVSVLFGGCMAGILLLINGYALHSELKDYYAESSKPLGKGANIVNVILVDFRALDTLGEITVLAIAALGILSLVRLRPMQDRKSND